MTSREMKRALVLFGATALLFFWPLLRGQTYFVGDVTYSFQPWFTYAAQELQAGRLPLWDPYSACGQPLMANPQLMTFNPTALLYWLFPFVGANALFLILSQGLLFFFTYLLARRWIGRSSSPTTSSHGPALLAALAFAWSGFASSHWEFPPAVATLANLPLLLLLVLGESWIALAGATALLFLTGYTQFAYYALSLALVGAVLVAFSGKKTPRDRMKVGARWVWAITLGVVLAAVQILPSWESAHQSLRSALTTEEARQYLLTPVFLLKLWIPWITPPVGLPFQATPFGVDSWSIQRNWLATLFLGTPVAWLAVAGLFRASLKKTLFLLAVTVLSAVLAFGIEPFFHVIRTWVPGLGYLTHFSNASILGLLCVTLWATEAARFRRNHGFFLTRIPQLDARTETEKTGFLTNKKVQAVAGTTNKLFCDGKRPGFAVESRDPTGEFGLILAALGLALGGVCLAFFPEARQRVIHALLGRTGLTIDQDRWVTQAAGASAALTLFAAGLWLFFRHNRWAALSLLTVFELWVFARALRPTAPGQLFHTPPVLAAALAETPFRFAVSPATLKHPKPIGGTNLVEGYRGLREAFYPNVPLPFRINQTSSYEVFGDREFGEFRRRLPDLPGESAAFDFLGAAHVMSTVPLPPPSQPRARRDNALLYERPTALERVTVVASARVIPSRSERLDYLFGSWQPRREVVLEEGNATTFSNAPTLFSWKETPGHVIAEGTGNGWLVYSGIYFPGWEASLNGKPTPLRRANHAFQAVETPSGKWEIHLCYRPILFRLGLGISLLGGIIFLALLIRPLQTRKGGSPTAIGA